MPYQAELDDLTPPQIRYGYAGNVLVYWPKVRGEGNVAISGSATYSIRRPGDSADASPIASGTATETIVGGVSRLSATIDASNTSVWQLQTHYYSILWTWTYSGIQHTYLGYFDVMRDPWVPDISLNDVVEQVSDMERRLSAQAKRLDATRTAAQHASVIGLHAWGDVSEWIRNKVAEDSELVANLVVDKERLRRIVVAQTVSRIYRAEGGGEDSESRFLAEDWARRAKDLFQGLGALRYDADDNRSAESTLGSFSITRQTRGVW